MVEEKILIVDDDEVELKADSDILKAVGYEVIGCRSGAEALEYLNNNPVELVLLDVNMPGMNGYDVCLNIRKQFPLDDLPIIFLTNQENEASVTQGFQSGASDFVCKNSAPDILLAEEDFNKSREAIEARAETGLRVLVFAEVEENGHIEPVLFIALKNGIRKNAPETFESQISSHNFTVSPTENFSSKFTSLYFSANDLSMLPSSTSSSAISSKS